MLALWVSACAEPPPSIPLVPSPLPARAVEVARSAGGEVRSVTVERDTRPSLVGPGRWELAVPRDTAGRFRSGVALLSGERACFRLTVDASTKEKCVEKSGAWGDLGLELPAAEGSSRVVLEITGGVGAWGDPVVIPLAADPRPDVVLLIFDTTRWDHFGAAGYTTRVTTPTLDAWLPGATVYTQARSPAPWTAPAIASALTGLLPTEHGAGLRVVRRADPKETREQKKLLDYAPLRPGVETVAARLRAAGYDTAGLAANGFFSPQMGLDLGYGRFVAYSGSDWAAARTGAARAAKLLRSRSAQAPPFFLTLHLVDPHHPYSLRLPPDAGYSVPTDLELARSGSGKREMVSLQTVDALARAHPEQTQVLYDAELKWMDAALQELFAVIPKDAVVIGFADHGEAFGEHGAFVHGNTLYDELLRVPLFVRYPQGDNAPVDTLVNTSAIAATILASAGLPHPGLTPLPRAGSPAPAATMFSEAMYSGPDQTALFEDGWKYIYTHPGAVTRRKAARSPAREQLFELTTDPGEARDRAESEPARLQAMGARVRAHLSARWPGVHVRCQGPVTLEVGSPELMRVDPLLAEPEDELSLRDGLTARLGPGVRELVLQTPGPADLSLGGGATWAQASVRSRDGGLPGSPPAEAPDTGACQVWEVQPAASAPSIDDETAAELEQLGYVGG